MIFRKYTPLVKLEKSIPFSPFDIVLVAIIFPETSMML